MATSTHNKYVSIPDWFSSSSSTPITSAEKPANITNVYYGGGSGGGTTGITEIPIDNKTIVWQDQVITVPIDNDKIIINTEGKITTSGTTGVWELRQLTDGTNYIYTTYPVVTQLGITMYAGTDGLDLGSIYDGLPIDNATIYWDLNENGNKILKAVGSSGGVADSVAWANVTGKPDWLLDGKIQYTEIEGIPDLSGFITKDYIDGKFVTFDLNETIDGIKTFTNGIKIGTSLINQSQNDVIYVDANLVVRGGITMYATGTVDIPSILDSLPVAGTESKGIASFDSSYFSVTNGKVTLLADNVGLNESELAEYLNTNNYAKKSDIPSLNGYATQSWVESKGYALNSDLMSLTTKVDDFLEGSDTDTIINKWLELEAFLSGLSESDNLATILSAKADKDYVDDTFVTLTTTQTITGEKNFTGGLKVNGSPIYYDTEKKHWKLEGDLLVTGGVTMYGSDSSFTPSTIMDAIAVDGTTISKDGGVLKVIGGTGGGVADSVAWANITGKPTWIGSTKPTYSYSEITGAISTTELQNYLTQNSYLNVTSGDNRYLKLGGGTLSGDIVFQDGYLRFTNSSGSFLGAYNVNDSGEALYFKGSTWNTILHSGNYSQYVLPLSGGTITSVSPVSVTLNANNDRQTALFFQSKGNNKTYVGWDIYRGTCLYDFSSDSHFGILNGIPRFNSNTIWHSGNDGDGSGLEADTIGTYKKDSGEKTIIYGTRSDNSNIRRIYDNGWNLMCQNGSDNGVIATLNSNVASATKLQTARTIWGQSFDGTGNIDGDFTQTKGGSYGGAYGDNSFYIYNRATSDVQGRAGVLRWAFNDYSEFKRLDILGENSGTTTTIASFLDNGNVGIGTTSPSYKLDVNGTFGASSAVFNGENGIKITYDLIERTLSGSTLYMQYHHNGHINMCYGGGNVGIGTPNPQDKLDVAGNIITSGGLLFTRVGTGTYNKFTISSNTTYGIEIEAPRATDSATGTALPIFIGWRGGALGIKITSGGNLLANGGITMYSDQRKKTIIKHVELSLKQIAEAPLIEHYYNSDDKKTTHVGSIAQYWANMNDWFCKLDSEGYYTMEIQNAALASAISIARELDRYETKTDKAIKTLKKRICELEEEVERLKAS